MTISMIPAQFFVLANKKKKWLVIIAILVNFGILLTLKYANFFGGNINSLLSKVGINLTIPKFNFILPLLFGNL